MLAMIPTTEVSTVRGEPRKPVMGRTLCGLGSDEGYVDAFVVEDRERLGWCVAGRDEVRDIAGGAEPEVGGLGEFAGRGDQNAPGGRLDAGLFELRVLIGRRHQAVRCRDGACAEE